MAKVCLLNPQQTLKLGKGTGYSVPEPESFNIGSLVAVRAAAAVGPHAPPMSSARPCQGVGA
jgi:hypothetical protein